MCRLPWKLRRCKDLNRFLRWFRRIFSLGYQGFGALWEGQKSPGWALRPPMYPSLTPWIITQMIRHVLDSICEIQDSLAIKINLLISAFKWVTFTSHIAINIKCILRQIFWKYFCHIRQKNRKKNLGSNRFWVYRLPRPSGRLYAFEDSTSRKEIDF